ncbi:MAG: hypothetical protein KC656_14475, partial [Myxococcales bacterium]|nr:hypothetical protein [Myxococcales bacterium]
MTPFLLSVAAAAIPLNGDFEQGNAHWFDRSPMGSDATVQRVTQGASFGGAFDTTGIVFTSPTHAMLLQNGSFADFTPAIVGSRTFLVTHTTARFQHYEQDATITLTARFDPDIGVAVELGDLVPSVGAFAEGTADLTAWCGVEGALQFSQHGDTVSATPLTLIDDVTVDTICPEYLDGDGDGYCPLG